jgi:hypothetical protein
MTLPPDTDLTKLTTVYVTSNLKNEQSHIDWLDAEIEALQAERTQHERERSRYLDEMSRRWHEMFKPGLRVRYKDGTIGSIISTDDSNYIRVEDAVSYCDWHMMYCTLVEA